MNIVSNEQTPEYRELRRNLHQMLGELLAMGDRIEQIEHAFRSAASEPAYVAELDRLCAVEPDDVDIDDQIQQDSGTDAMWNAFARVYVAAFDAIDGSTPDLDDLELNDAKEWAAKLLGDRAGIEERIRSMLQDDSARTLNTSLQ